VSSRNLEYLLAPHSVALIGASDRAGSVGATVMRNLIAGHFDGRVWPVNLRHSQVAGQQAYRSIWDVPAIPDLAIICTPAPTVPKVISQLGAAGIHAAVVLSAGTSTQEMLEAARPYTLRILGPNSLGLQLPRIGLNASFAHTQALRGNLAFIAQSGALAAAMLDWARTAQIGFSCLVSLGDGADVDFGDLLDYLSHDVHTRAILLYVESISGARKFMSAARAAARNKPLIVVKAGRHADTLREEAGALANPDDVYDAAFCRSGMLRVETTRELFDAAETLARLRPLTGERLAIISNGGGPAVMATDALIAGGGKLAARADFIGEAPAERYVDALRAVLADATVDAALVIHSPSAIIPAAEIATAVSDEIVASARPVLTCWMGGESVREARRICSAAGVPNYSTPEEGIGAFLHAVRYQRNQRQLMEVPSSIPESFVTRPDEVRALVARVLAEGRSQLDEHEASQVLSAYGISVVNARERRTRVQELVAGMTVDPTFGPVILFGKGGVNVEAAPDTAVGFPPLNNVLAAELIARTRVSRQLAGFRSVPPVDRQALERTLVQLSQLVVDCASIVEVEINPLLADEQGVIALGARVRVAPARGASADRLAIRPYPKELEERYTFEGRTVLLRPLRPEDAPQHREFISQISAEDMHSRFFRVVKELPDADLAHLTQLDYERAMAFIAVSDGPDGVPETLGVVRAQADPDNDTAEFAVLVRSDLKGHGLGRRLMDKIIRYCRDRGTRRLAGDVLATNTRMLQLAAASGFHTEPAREGAVRIVMNLTTPGTGISSRKEG